MILDLEPGNTALLFIMYAALTSYRPGGSEMIWPLPSPPMAVQLAADLRPSADGSAVLTSLVADGG